MYDSKSLMIDWLLEFTNVLEIVDNITPSIGIRPALVEPTNSSAAAVDRCFPAKPYTDSMRTLRFFVDVLAVSLFSAFGLVGNALSVAVLRMTGCCPTTSLLLQALAVADSVFLVTCIVFQCLEAFYFFSRQFREAVRLFPYAQLALWPVAGIAQMTGVWLVVLVTVERYLAVCHPLTVKRVATMTKTRMAVAAVFAFAFLFNIPTFFDLEMVRVQCDENRAQLMLNATQFFRHYPYQLVYKTILCFIFRTALPICVVVYCNVRLVSAVRASAKSFPSNSSISGSSSSHGTRATATTAESSQQKKGDDLNTITVFLVVVFVACEFPDAVNRVLRTVKFYAPSLPIEWVHFWVMAIATNFLLTVNSSVNVVIYAVTGKRFRSVLLHRFCRKQAHLPPSNV